MLDTRFPRLPGEVGNARTFAFETLYRRVPSATVESVVVADRPAPAVAADILEAARALEAEGADLVVTSCGFLASLQDELAGALRVPVLTSALLLLPLLRRVHGSGAVLGVITFDSRKLDAEALAPFESGPLAVAGLERSATLYPAIAEDRDSLDPVRAEADAVAAADRLMTQAPSLSAVLLECTNISPYRPAIAAACGRPVHDLVQAIEWLAAAQARR